MTSKIIPPPKGLTDYFIKTLKPQASRYELADNACIGLRIRVGTTGKKPLSGYIVTQLQRSLNA